MLVRTQDLKSLDVRLCPQCLERYTAPCAAVVVERDGSSVGHIVLLRYSIGSRGIVFYNAVRCCGSGRDWLGLVGSASDWGFPVPFVHERDEWCGVFCVGHKSLFDAEFLNSLLLHYPALVGQPLTERVLREAGCDIEAELAMWQLGKQWG
jgi:hypothetical protein